MTRRLNTAAARRRGVSMVLPLALCLLVFACEQPTDTQPDNARNPNTTDTPAENAVLSALTIAELPYITLYARNQPFESEGLVLTGIFSDESERHLTASEYTVDAVDTSKPGVKWAAVRAGTLTARFGVYVDLSDRVLQSAKMTSAPSKTSYYLGEAFSKAGMVVTASYSDGTSAALDTAAVAASGYESTVRGTRTVGFRVNRLSLGNLPVTVKVPASAQITVNARKDAGYAAQIQAYKPAYIKGEDFDPERANLQAMVKANGITATQYGGRGIGAADITGHNPWQTGFQTLRLTLDEAPPVEFEIFVADTEPSVYFDYGFMRHSGDPNGAGPAAAGVYYAKPGETLALAPVRFLVGYDKYHKDTGADYLWSVNGGAYTDAGKTGEFFLFTPGAAGEYTVTVSVTGVNYLDGKPITKTASTGVVCYAASVPAAGRSFVGPLKNFAPGQFTEAGNGYGWSLGAQGGYEVWRVEHREEYTIRGNAMLGWSEPGVVWVMEDNNKNGLPDEMWYELKGSEDLDPKNKEFVTRRYALTYFKSPRHGNMELGMNGFPLHQEFWVDNRGRAWLFPGGWPGQWGVEGDWVTYTGTTLRDKDQFAVGLYDASNYGWGYADLWCHDGSQQDKFRISNAMRADGTPVTLTNVAFIKVQTALFQYHGIFGEISTEVYAADFLGSQTDFPLP